MALLPLERPSVQDRRIVVELDERRYATWQACSEDSVKLVAQKARCVPFPRMQSVEWSGPILRITVEHIAHAL